METKIALKTEAEIKKALEQLGNGEAVRRFFSSYGNARTKRAYCTHLASYFAWLRETKGVTMDPDQLVKDNLINIYRSEPEDVASKRKHRGLLEEYVNEEMVRQGFAEMSRMVLASAVSNFYSKNDSPLFGKVTVSRGAARIPPKPLEASDIRTVLKALPIQTRTPLLCMWQSSCEINRILGLRWKDLDGFATGAYPVRLQFYGRKRHRKAYHTYLGRDSVQALKLWAERWREIMGRDPASEDLVFVSIVQTGMEETWLGREMRRMALRLHKQGLIKNGDPASWHTHYLRHNFKTEASHAKIEADAVEFFMGHLAGIQWVYNHTAESHEEDLIAQYEKLEPFVSLDYTETTMRTDFESREKMYLNRVLSLEKTVEELKRAFASAPRSPGPA
ncbi:MAG: site-specific integrase [Nitrososphaerales archaeon]|jgi:integrase